MCDAPGLHIKFGLLNPPAVALQSYEIRGACIRNGAVPEGAPIADIRHDDFIGADSFERGGTVIIVFAFHDQSGNLLDVGTRKLIGIRPYDLDLSGASRDGK
jgi:hypothetical protein